MKNYYNILLLVVFLFISCKTEDPTASNNNIPEMSIVNSIGDSNKIEIVTWNIEHFPKAKYSDDYVKSIIEGLDADIYMLQEIQSRDKFTSILSEMVDYNYLIQLTNTTLNLAFVYKRDLITIKSSYELFVDDPYFFAGRPPLLANIEWQNSEISMDLAIINVHYKCCGNNSISYVPDEDGKWDEEYRRLKSSELLHSYIMDNLNTENVIVAGDWNDAIQEPDSTNVFKVFIDDSTNFRFTDMDIAIGDAINWSWQGWSSSYPAIHFDHILINHNLFDEQESSGEIDVIKLEEYFSDGSTEYKKNVSDHRPVYLKFSP